MIKLKSCSRTVKTNVKIIVAKKSNRKRTKAGNSYSIQFIQSFPIKVRLNVDRSYLKLRKKYKNRELNYMYLQKNVVNK
jgi:hypothetical protein